MACENSRSAFFAAHRLSAPGLSVDLISNPISPVVPVDAVAVVADGATDLITRPVRRYVALSVEGACSSGALLVLQVQHIAPLLDRALK